MVKTSAVLIAALVGTLAITPPTYAHSGGLNADGCHAGSQPYHCHRGNSNSQRAIVSTGGDRDCRDFSSWAEAQDFYERAGPGDPHRLDADRDGIACEALR